MAEINSEGGGKGGKKRSKKASTKVDMTPMVDLAFLLITFFMLTTTFNKKHAMQITIPAKSKEKQKVKMSESVTLILGEKDRIYWYDDPKKPELKQTDFSANGIREMLLKKNDQVDSLIVVVKPMQTSKYKNLVDVMDEIKITQTKISAIVDITKEDEELVKGYEAKFN
jgi:biopolymer transport protein ExbD